MEHACVEVECCQLLHVPYALNKVPVTEQLVLRLVKVLRLVLILSEAEEVQHGRTQVAPHPLQWGGQLHIVGRRRRPYPSTRACHPSFVIRPCTCMYICALLSHVLVDIRVIGVFVGFHL
jgi:hypothetical protein